MEYRKRYIDVTLQKANLFKGIELDDYRRIVIYLLHRLSFVRVQPGQTLFEYGAVATHLYFVRLGHVRFSVPQHGREAKVISSGPGTILGEIGLLALNSEGRKTVDELDRALKLALDKAGEDLSGVFPPGMRTATCSALNQLELAQLNRTDFLQMLRKFSDIRRRVVEQSLARMRSSTIGHRVLDDYVANGL